MIPDLSGHCSHFDGPGILHADVSWPPSEMTRLWSASVDSPQFGAILTWNKSNLQFLKFSGQICKSGHVLENAWDEWPEIWHVHVFWSPSYLIRFWSQSVDFPYFGTIYFYQKWLRSLLFWGVNDLDPQCQIWHKVKVYPIFSFHAITHHLFKYFKIWTRNAS